MANTRRVLMWGLLEKHKFSVVKERQEGLLESIREHHRKVRKEAKKRGRKKPKKDPGVPSAAPFKEELLREAEQRKQRGSSGKSKAKTNKLLDKNSKKSFCRELKKVIEASDVVLEVLDARDPMGCRCPQLEQAVTCSGGDKKLLLVLNKIDLVPKENLEKWLNYLKKEFPTVAFKSATMMKDKTMPEQFTKRRARVDLSRTTECFGSKCLLKLLQEHGKTQNKVIQVGVVGFPNVGKSSIINSLKGVRACNVGLARGVTKSMQIVHIDKQTKMLDSPSIIADPSNSALALALRSIIDTEESGSADVLEGVDAILNHCSKQQVMMHYSIPDFRNTEEILTLLAQKRALKYPSPASSIIFQSAGMANGTIEENEVIEVASEWENLETSKEGKEEEEEDFTESDDDQDDEEEEEEKDVKEETKVQVTRKAKLGKRQTNPTNSEKQIAESEHSNSLSFSLDKTADEDDAYDFNTDYV
ncbi:PREDICTED: guanine nucleotide-binding protein-like 3 [Pygoscelis adeliae]|uniref:guanine nucleotide-binding protein-like 3 n=1 Tax=Pygoscelis adeliae TaxID=9238 RepID=UPI0004F50A5D|nr:PREDICTED: guanine nucleotide-binding protein-like 3 [Pygoscelis adeliae]